MTAAAWSAAKPWPTSSSGKPATTTTGWPRRNSCTSCKLSEKILGSEDLDIEVEYQQATIGKFGLAFDGTDFLLTPKQTACLAQDACGIPAAPAFALPQLQMAACTPGGGCC